MSVERPEVSTELAISLAKTVFGFTHISKVKELISYCDRNFYIEGKRLHDDHEPGEFVLKVLNAEDSQDKEQLDAELKAMEFLRKKGFPCPEMYSAKGTEDKIQMIELPRAERGEIHDQTVRCAVRLLAFLSGDVVDSSNRCPELMFTVGKVVGALSLQLKDFSHSGLKSRSEHNFQWDVLDIVNLEKYLGILPDDSHFQLFRQVREAFISKVKSKLGDFRRGAVHNDLNGENILVSKPPYVVTGIFDFGDCTESVLISELSNSMTSYMKGDRGIEFSGYLLAGYQSVFPLPDLERNLLYFFIAARLTQLVVYSECSLVRRPDDKGMQDCKNKYLAILKHFWSCSKEEVEKIWQTCEEKASQLF